MCESERLLLKFCFIFSETKKPRSQSARRPKPRYAKPMIESFPTSRPATADFNSTTDIREQVYLDWYKERTDRAKKEREERKKREEEEKKKKEEVRTSVQYFGLHF